MMKTFTRTDITTQRARDCLKYLRKAHAILVRAEKNKNLFDLTNKLSKIIFELSQDDELKRATWGYYGKSPNKRR